MTRRTQADRRAATRAALVEAGRAQFAKHGYAGVGTEAIGRAAAVSRGALYHHFADKSELFEAALVAVEADVTERMATAALAGEDLGLVPMMMRAMNAWLDACEAPDVQRILLLDGPAVLGWARWREVCQPFVLALVEDALARAVADGTIEPLPVRPLAHALVAMGDEAAMYVVTADDKTAARQEMTSVFERMLAALVVTPPA